jgi:hypothetical protein
VFTRQEVSGKATRLLCIALICDVVPFKDAPGLVSGDFHDHSLGDTSPTEIPDSCSTQVMEEQVSGTGPLACMIPAFPKIPYALRTAGEQILAVARLQFEKFLHIAVDRDGDWLRLAILFPPFHPDTGRIKVDLRPLDP